MSPEDNSSRYPGGQPSFFGRHGRRLLALPLWLGLLGGYGLYTWRTGLSPPEGAQRLVHFMTAGAQGALLYVALWVVRPLILFPASLLAVAAGFAFGPILGILLTVVGSNASAGVAYLVGRHLGRGVLELTTGPEEPTERTRKYARRMRKDGFWAMLVAQSAYLPFDLVNYLAGFLRVGWKPFTLATLLGSLPGIISFVLLGASFEMDLAAHKMGFDPRVFLASAAILGGSILLSGYLKRRGREEPGPDGA